MLRSAISRIGTRLHLHSYPHASHLSPSSHPLRALSTRRGKGSSPTAEPDDDGPLRGLFMLSHDPERPPRLLVVQPRLRPGGLLDSKLAEALNLANSLEEPRDGFYQAEFASKGAPPHLVVQNPASRGSSHSDTYFGPGTVDNVKCYLRASESEEGLDAVFVNAILSGIQQRNLEVAWGKLVLDRVGLIIEIFNALAETKEAKLQEFLSRYLINVTHQVISGMRAWGALVIGICLTILLRLLLYTGRVSSAYVHED